MTDTIIKEAKKKEPAKPEKKYFDVKIECQLPATITYRIYAETAEQAVDLIKTQAPTSVKYNVLKRKNIKATIYDAGSSLIRFVKKFKG